VHHQNTLGAQAYQQAFSVMVRANTSLILLKLPPLVTSGGDEMLLQHFDQMNIEQGLNKVGRGGTLLSSTQTTRGGTWVDHALHK
jgi:hypothetical protein